MTEAAIEKKVVSISRHSRAASVRAESFDNDGNTVDVVWTTGMDVLRSHPMLGDYIERLSTGPENVRLDRLNAGAAFLDTHDKSGLGAVIGTVVPGSARMEGGQGLATVQLSRSARASDTVQDIKDGVIRNVSVGYVVHAFERTKGDDENPTVMNATDWEPLEISAVPVPADPGAQIISAARSASGVELNSCTIFTKTREADLADKTDIKDVYEDQRDDATDTEDNTDAENADGENKRTKRSKRDDDKADADEKKDGKDADDSEERDDDEDDKGGEKKEERKFTAADVRKLATEAVAAERSRMNEITELARKYDGVAVLAETYRSNGSSVQAFKDAILDKLAKRSASDERHATVAEPSLAKKKDEVSWEGVRKHFGNDRK